jgi:hypothetical protein
MGAHRASFILLLCLLCLLCTVGALQRQFGCRQSAYTGRHPPTRNTSNWRDIPRSCRRSLHLAKAEMCGVI